MEEKQWSKNLRNDQNDQEPPVGTVAHSVKVAQRANEMGYTVAAFVKDMKEGDEILIPMTFGQINTDACVLGIVTRADPLAFGVRTFVLRLPDGMTVSFVRPQSWPMYVKLPLIPESDPELERLLAEEDEIPVD